MIGQFAPTFLFASIMFQVRCLGPTGVVLGVARVTGARLSMQSLHRLALAASALPRVPGPALLLLLRTPHTQLPAPTLPVIVRATGPRLCGGEGGAVAADDDHHGPEVGGWAGTAQTRLTSAGCCLLVPSCCPLCACRPAPFWASWVLLQGLLAAVEACLLVGFGYAFGFRLVSGLFHVQRSKGCRRWVSGCRAEAGQGALRGGACARRAAKPCGSQAAACVAELPPLLFPPCCLSKPAEAESALHPAATDGPPRPHNRSSRPTPLASPSCCCCWCRWP